MYKQEEGLYDMVTYWAVMTAIYTGCLKKKSGICKFYVFCVNLICGTKWGDVLVPQSPDWNMLYQNKALSLKWKQLKDKKKTHCYFAGLLKSFVCTWIQRFSKSKSKDMKHQNWYAWLRHQTVVLCEYFRDFSFYLRYSILLLSSFLFFFLLSLQYKSIILNIL